MHTINKTPWLKKSLEGAALLVALLGLFYLGQAVSEIRYISELNEQVPQDSSAALLNATNGYEYVLIDRSRGIREFR